MDTARAERAEAVTDGPAALPLVRAAAALRWSRPDLTATLAELALESAPDAATWVAAAGWLLHGRTALGDGRDTACVLLDGLARWGDAAAVLMGGPEGRRLRVELAGPARRIGETAIARALLAAASGADETDLELRADVLTELARCAVDDAPDTLDDALTAAEAAWRAAASVPGVASVTLLHAARSRRAGRAEVAVAEAVDGLAQVRGRRAGATASDHLVAALTAEWIAALVDGGLLDQARTDGVAAANRLVATARASRQVAGLRLAIARVTAVEESPDAVLAALEPAAQVAADSDVPELESACRSMLGELHEAAGRLDAALAALRAAMSADRRDRERAAQLRARLTAAAGTWAEQPSIGPAGVGGRDPVHAASVLTASLDGARWSCGDATADQPSAAGLLETSGTTVDRRRAGPGSAGSDGPCDRERTTSAPGDAADPLGPSTGRGRRARRLAAEALEHEIGGTSAVEDGVPDGDPRAGRAAAARAGAAGRVAPAGRARHGAESASGAVPGPVPTSAPAATPAWGNGSTPGADSIAYRAPGGGGSLIGDALLRELAGGGPPTVNGLRSPTHRGAAATHPMDGDPSRRVAGLAANDPLFGPLGVDGPRGTGGHRPPGAVAHDPGREAGSGGGPADAAIDSGTLRWDRSTGRSSSNDDTVVIGAPVTGQADLPARQPRVDDGARAADDPAASTSSGSSGTPGTANGSGPARRGAAGRGPGRPPSTDTDGLGLADLLAGALAAYRDL